MSSEKLLLKTEKIIKRTRMVLVILIILAASTSTTNCVWGQGFSPKKEPNSTLTNITTGKIDSEVFSRSVSRIMTVGKTYAIILPVTNTGSVKADFVTELIVPFRSSYKYFFCMSWRQTVTLFPGESQSVEFLITPLLENVGPLELRGLLYVNTANLTNLVDIVEATVFEIRLAFQPWSIVLSVGVVLFMAIGILIWFYRRVINKKTTLTLFVLFSFAVLLRAPSLLKVAVFPDEYTLWIEGVQILNKGWQWPKELMYGYPPLWMYLEAVIVFLFGSRFEMLRAISVVSGALSVVMLYLLGKSLFGKKVGLISALLLGFSNLHIIYSRVAMTDSLMLFLMLSSSYFFWEGYKNNSWKYMCLSGVFFGLSFNVKYIIIVQILACIFFVFWVEKSWRRLRALTPSLLTWIIAFFIVISPVQFTLIKSGVNAYEQYTSRLFYAGPVKESFEEESFEVINYPIGDFIFRGLKLGVHIFTRGGSPWLPWLTAFEISVFVLLLIGILYHVYPLLRRQTRESFVVISSVGSLFLIAFYSLRHYYWLLYFLPWFLIMLSNLSIRCARSLHMSLTSKYLSRKPLDSFRILMLLLVGVFVFSQVTVGAATPVIDRGEFDGFRQAMLYVKNRVQPGEVISEPWMVGTLYYINLFDINVTFVPLFKFNVDPPWIERPKGVVTFSIDEQVFTVWKPRFIILSRAHLNFYFNTTMKSEIFENYSIVFVGTPSVGYILKGDKATDLHVWMVFERVISQSKQDDS